MSTSSQHASRARSFLISIPQEGNRDSERPGNASLVTQLISDSLGTSKPLLTMVWGGVVIIIFFFLSTHFLPLCPSLPACYLLPGEFASLLRPRGPIRGLLQGGRLKQSLPLGGLPELKF